MRNVSNKEREKLSAEIAGLESFDLRAKSSSRATGYMSRIEQCVCHWSGRFSAPKEYHT